MFGPNIGTSKLSFLDIQPIVVPIGLVQLREMLCYQLNNTQIEFLASILGMKKYRNVRYRCIHYPTLQLQPTSYVTINTETNRFCTAIKADYSIVKDSSADLGVNFKIAQNRPTVKAVCTKFLLHICQYFYISERK